MAGSDRWPIWTDGGAGSPMGGARPAAWVYRLADGSYLTARPDADDRIAEEASRDRPTAPDGQPLPPQWNGLTARLPRGPTTDALIADLERAGGRPEGEALGRLAAALAADPAAAWLPVATGVRAEWDRNGWVGRPNAGKWVTVRVVYFL